MPDVRDLRDSDSDYAAVAVVARACDESGPISGASSGYLSHVAQHGRVAVAEDFGSVVGFGGIVEVRGVSVLTDLFVAPGHRDSGRGSALLGELWSLTGPRATSSSQDPRALAAYARYGARPLWPLLYLRIPGASVDPAAPVRRHTTVAGDADWTLELDDLMTLTVLSGPGISATTAVVLEAPGRISVLRALTPDPRGLPVLLAELTSRVGVGGFVDIVVPGPHPALPDLLGSGARVLDVDLWCATHEAAGLIDPARELPSPALA